MGRLSPLSRHKQEKQGMYNCMVNIVPSSKLNLDETNVSIENVTFHSMTSFLFVLKFKGKKTLQVKNSAFINGTILCLHKRGSCESSENSPIQLGGAVTILLGADKKTARGCTSGKGKKNVHPSWNYDSLVTFEDSTFEGNEGLSAGAVYLSNGFASFHRCSFRNNFALQRGGHVTVAPGSGQVEFLSSTFSQTQTISKAQRSIVGPTFVQFLYSESLGRLNVSNTSMIYGVSSTNPQPVVDIVQGGYVDIDRASNIHCSVGNRMTLENYTHLADSQNEVKPCKLNLTVLRFSCGLCPPGMYSLQNGTTSGLFVQKGFQCLFCPYGASCIHNIVAKPNFWGYLVSSHPPSLNFTTCPEEYCSPPRGPDTSVYNGCHGNRTGVLCGSCREGFTESLFTEQFP